MTEIHPSGHAVNYRKWVRGKWDYISLKMKRRGVVEVNNSHPHYSMLQCLQTGIREVLEQHPDLKAKDSVSEEDYNHVLTKTVHVEGKTGVVESYATSVFASLRRAVSISEEEFLESLAPPELPYLEFISNSRSGQDFYFSNDQRFIMKTDNETCIMYFISILREYLEHFLKYPHSLLVKFLGLYSVKMSSGRKKFMLVMQSIFYPSTRMEERFDLKGCLCNRYQSPNPSGKPAFIVLKDQNFLDEKIALGPQKDWFIQQLTADVEFLRQLGVQDYSLLLGKQPLHISEQRESVGNLVVRMRKSFGALISPDEITEVSQTHQGGVTDQATPTDQACAANQNTPSHTEKHNVQMKKTSILLSLSDKAYLESLDCNFHNQRLLLNCKNCLHIIDGTSERYFVGIIDFFTQWKCQRRLAKYLKDIKHCCKEHSTEPPDYYADRFVNFIVERTC